MSGIVNSGIFESEQAVADVAGYISRLPMNPTPSHGDGQNLVRGEALYKTSCASRCHGQEGEGRNFKLWPRLQGQHYEYLVRQMELFLDGERRFADNLMISRLNKFSEEDIKAVADYLSRVKPDTELQDVPPAQEASPDVYKVLAENDQWRVLEATWQPGQEDSFHSHPPDRVSRHHTNCKLRLTESDNTFRDVTLVAGTVKTITGDPIEKQKAKNVGDNVCVIQIIELK
jgi:cytochrome c553